MIQISIVRGVPIVEDSNVPGIPMAGDRLDGFNFNANLSAAVLRNQDTYPNVLDYGAKGDGVTDDTLAIRGLIEKVYARDGGHVFLPPGKYFVTQEIQIPERVVLAGYGSPGWDTSGTVPRPTCIVVPNDAAITNTQGVLRCVYRGPDAAGRRHNGGVRDLSIKGGFNFGGAGNPVHHGIIISGCRFVEITRVHLLRMGGHGVYGVTDVTSPNGLQLHACFSGFNGQHGYSVGGGDNVVTHCIAGTNTLDGFNLACGNTSITNCLAWNNLRDGVAEAGVNSNNMYSAVHAYDNERAGFSAYSGASYCTWSACHALDNGRNLQGVYTSAVDRVGFLFLSGGVYDTCQVIGGLACGVRAATQDYGLSMRSTTGALDVLNLKCLGNNLAAHFLAGGTFRSRPFSDNQVILGDSINRLLRVTSADFRVHSTAAAANPTMQLDSTGLRFGAGTTNALDTQLSRPSADLLQVAAGDSFKIADGTWNGGNLRLGSYFLWVDGTGRLRIKSSTPTSDTDGVVVGTQA